MRAFIQLAILALFTVDCCAERFSISSLAIGERVTIDYDCDADRSGYRRVYEISRGHGTTMVIYELHRWGYGEDTRQTPPKKVLIGEIVLSAKDTEGLDRLLDFYRVKKWGDSTTTEHVVVEYRREGILLGKEEFVDRSSLTRILELSEAMEDSDFLNQNSGGVDIKLLKSLIPLYRFDRRLWPKEANPVAEGN
jgi:hypothetical protein